MEFRFASLNADCNAETTSRSASLNADCWGLIFSFFNVESTLEMRLVCSDWEKGVTLSLDAISERNDLPPCERVKDLIRNYAHSKRFWRCVPSFSLQQKIGFEIVKSKQKRKFSSLQAEAFYFAIKIKQPLNFNENVYNCFFSVSAPVNEKIARTLQLITNPWNELDKNEFSTVARYVFVSGSHRLIIRILKETRRRSLQEKRTIFKLMVTYGVSPYYLEQFQDVIESIRLFDSKRYHRIICACHCEYLLKLKLKKDGHAFVDKHYQWERGRYLCMKYKNKH